MTRGYLNYGGDFTISAAGLTGTIQGSSDFTDVDGDGDAVLITGKHLG